ncbi:MAG: Gfo/Idh/MocA family oxidoreductase [Thermoguttaceae bacterium]|jgi:hypothetical protein
MPPANSSVRRRAFLAAGAASVPLFVSGRALGADGNQPASERIGFAVMGLGDRGPGHCGMGKAAQLIAVCDPWKNRREKIAAARKCDAYADHRDALARKDIDAIVIATPDHWHVPMAIAAAKAGKDVFCEKALGVSIAEDLAIRDAFKRLGRVFQYGPQRRTSGNFRLACELVRNKRIGEVREIEVIAPTFGACAPKVATPAATPEDLAYDIWLGPAPEAPYVPGRCQARGWYCIYDYCIGWISAWGSHILSIVQWGFDTHRAGAIEVEGTGTIPGVGLNDNLTHWDTRFKFASGPTMTFKTGGSNHVKFIGSEGWVEVGDRGSGSEPASLWKSPIGADEIHLKSGDLHEDFVAAVKTRGTTMSPLDDAVYSDILTHLADIAIRLKRKVVWDPAKETFVGDPAAVRLMTRASRGNWQ